MEKIQKNYAKVIEIGSTAGFALLIVTFLLYTLGIITPLVPIDTVTRLWSESANQYIESTGTPTGWNWVFGLNKADLLCYVGLALLSLVSIVAFAVNLPAAFKTNRVYFVLFLAIIVVLCAAASGLISVGH